MPIVSVLFSCLLNQTVPYFSFLHLSSRCCLLNRAHKSKPILNFLKLVCAGWVQSYEIPLLLHQAHSLYRKGAVIEKQSLWKCGPGLPEILVLVAERKGKEDRVQGRDKKDKEMRRKERREYRGKRGADYKLTLIWDRSRGSRLQTILLSAYVPHVTWTYAKQTINHQGTEKAFCCKAAC